MAEPDSKKLVLISVILAGVLGGAYFWWLGHGTVKTDDASIEAHIIPIAPKVSGYVVELNIKDNQHVKKGDVILKIDQRDYQVALEQAQAQLMGATAALAQRQHELTATNVSAPSNLASAQSDVEGATAEWNNAVTTLKRYKALGTEATSRQSLDNAIAAEARARSALENAKARLKTAETAPETIASSEESVKQIESDVAFARAAVQKAQNNLNDTVIIAPTDGRITRRSVEQGAFVQPGQQLTTIVGDDIWVAANFKETQLNGMKQGQNVEIEIDAYPDAKFTGKVDSIQAGTGARFSLFPPENATGNFVKIVQRVPVKITFDTPPGEKFPVGPGMSVIPKVRIK